MTGLELLFVRALAGLEVIFDEAAERTFSGPARPVDAERARAGRWGEGRLRLIDT